MESEQKTYIAIDLKSFYASVECVERGFDPLVTNLVVADESRTEKTICLAVSPSLKAYGISGRARLFEVVSRVNEINRERLKQCGAFTGDSFYDDEVQKDKTLALSYYVAPPRMKYYMNYSSKIYSIYLKYVSKEDIHVYSIDEVFIDVTPYLKTYHMSAHQLAMTMIQDVLKQTGITATCGIAPNLFLCKVAMDIVAKHIPPDKDGVRIAELDDFSYRVKLWDHQPLTDFWRIGPGIQARLNANGMYTMGDVAMMSLMNEEKLYKLFGINAELIIDHAWGYEPVTIKDIKEYRPLSNSLSSGQVLKKPYNYEKTKLIIKEMTDLLVLDLVDKKLLTNQVVLSVGYDTSNMKNYHGQVVQDPYGRKMPKMAHGSQNLSEYTSSTDMIMEAVLKLFDRIIDKNLTVRRVYIVANHLISEADYDINDREIQLDLFTDANETIKKEEEHRKKLAKERKLQQATLKIQKKYGKNALIKANSLEEDATTIERNNQVGGHHA